jgi:hypothetical protein
MGGFITDALSAFETFLAFFSNYRQTTMIEGTSGILRCFVGSLASLGMTSPTM